MRSIHLQGIGQERVSTLPGVPELVEMHPKDSRVTEQQRRKNEEPLVKLLVPEWLAIKEGLV